MFFSPRTLPTYEGDKYFFETRNHDIERELGAPGNLPRARAPALPSSYPSIPPKWPLRGGHVFCQAGIMYAVSNGHIRVFKYSNIYTFVHGLQHGTLSSRASCCKCSYHNDREGHSFHSCIPVHSNTSQVHLSICVYCCFLLN